MSIASTLSKDGGTVTIQVNGRFDFSTHQEFLKVYKQYAKGEKRFVVDLKSADYLDSSALGMLLQLRDHSSRAAEVRLVNSSDVIQDILRIANFDRLFQLA